MVGNDACRDRIQLLHSPIEKHFLNIFCRLLWTAREPPRADAEAPNSRGVLLTPLLSSYGPRAMDLWRRKKRSCLDAPKYSLLTWGDRACHTRASGRYMASRTDANMSQWSKPNLISVFHGPVCAYIHQDAERHVMCR